MYNLVITIISMILTTVLTAAGIYYYSAILIPRHDEAVARALVDQARQIYVASTLYAEEHNGAWPDNTEQLRGRYLRSIPRAPDNAFAAAGGFALITSTHAAELGNPHSWVFVNDPVTRRQLYVRLAGEVRAEVCQAVADLAQNKPAGAGAVGRNLDPRSAIQCVSGGAGWETPTFVWVTPGSPHSSVCGVSGGRGESCRYLADGTLAPDVAEAAAAAVAGSGAITIQIPSGAKLARLEGGDLSFSNSPYPVPSWKLTATADVALTGQPIEYPLDWGIQGVPTPLGWTDSFYPIPPSKAPARKTGRSRYATEVYATLEEAQSNSVGVCRNQAADIYEYAIDCDGKVIAYAVICQPSGKVGAELLAMELACDLPGYAGGVPVPESCGVSYSTGSGEDKKVYTGTVQTCNLTQPSAVPYPEDGRCQMRLRDDGRYEPYPQDPDCSSRSGRPGCPVPAVALDGVNLQIDFGMNTELESCAPTALEGCTKTAEGAWAC